jgi:hypothetical protein
MKAKHPAISMPAIIATQAKGCNLDLRHSVSRHKGANCGLGTLIKIKMT